MSNQNSGFQTGSINLPMVMIHLVLLLIQTACAFVSFNPGHIIEETHSLSYKVLCSLYVIDGALDIILSYLISSLLYDSAVTSMIEKGTPPTQMHDTVSSNSDPSSSSANDSSESDGEEGHSRLQRRMNETRDSFRMHGIRYYECFKATSLWLNEIQVIESRQDDFRAGG
jgi:hypothetical protein